MTLLLVVSGIVLLLSLLVLAAVALRHLPELRVLNIETDVQAKSHKKKEELILGHLLQGSAPMAKLGRALKGTTQHLRRIGRRSVHRLRALESHYQDLKRLGKQKGNLSQDELLRALDEAAALVREEEWTQAEKKYIEIISFNPKEVKAYEHLGRLYTKTGQFDQADQCLRFAAKLRPDDASVRASLGELYMGNGQWTRALEELGRAIEKRPGNAKYLDRYIETALALKNMEKAQAALDQLKESNPENQKIVEFEARLNALRAE